MCDMHDDEIEPLIEGAEPRHVDRTQASPPQPDGKLSRQFVYVQVVPETAFFGFPLLRRRSHFAFTSRSQIRIEQTKRRDAGALALLEHVEFSLDVSIDQLVVTANQLATCPMRLVAPSEHHDSAARAKSSTISQP